MPGPEFNFLPELPNAKSNHDRIGLEIQRLYPQIIAPKIVQSRQTPFYDGFCLLEINAEIDGQPSSWWALYHPTVGVFVIDALGTEIDRIDRIAPLAWSDTTAVIQYLRFRLAFLRDHSQAHSFGLLNGDEIKIISVQRDSSVDAQFQLYDWSADRQLRQATITARVKPGIGIFSAQVEDSWAYPTEEAAAQLKADAVPTIDIARIPTPFFIDSWEDRWTSDAHLKFPSASPRQETKTPYALLLKGFGVELGDGIRTVIRATRLPFYRTIRLFEVVVLGRAAASTSAEIGYCLGRPDPQRPEEWQFLWLNGTSLPLHEANALKTSEGLGELVLDEHDELEFGKGSDRVAAYIRLFCWATEGEEGPFFALTRLDRFEYTAKIPDEIVRIVDEAGSPSEIRRVDPNEGSKDQPAETKYIRECFIIYARVLFRSHFAVQANGMIEMTDDEPLSELEIPIDIARVRASTRRRWIAPQPQNTPPKRGDTQAADDASTAPQPAARVVEGVKTLENHVFTTPTAVIEHLSGARSVIMRDCRFEDGLNMGGREISCSVTFVGCKFTVPPDISIAIDLSEMQIDGSIRFVDCFIAGDLLAVRSKIGGNFEILNCVVAHSMPDESARLIARMSDATSRSFQMASSGANSFTNLAHINLTAVSTAGGVLIGADDQSAGPIRRSIVTGDILLSRSHVERDLIFRGLGARDVYLTNAEVKQTCILGTDMNDSLAFDFVTEHPNVCLEIHALSAFGLKAGSLTFGHLRLGEDTATLPYPGDVDLNSAAIAGDVLFFRVTINGHVSLYAVVIKGSVNFDETSINGNIEAAYAEISRFFWAGSRNKVLTWPYFLNCRGDLTLSGATIGGVELSGAKIDGKLQCTTGKLGCLYIAPSIVRVAGKMQIALTRLRNLDLTNVEITDDIRIIGVRVASSPATLFEYFISWLDRLNQSRIRIENSLIGGHLRTFPRDHTVVEQLRLDHKDLMAREPAVRDFINALESQDGSGRSEVHRTVVGDLLLRANQFDGSVELRDVNVYGKIVLADSEIGIDLLVGASRDVMQGRETGLATQCVEADFEKIVCRGDANLTGLTARKVLERQVDDNDRLILAKSSGVLKLRDSEVKGDLTLVEEDDDETAPEKVEFAYIGLGARILSAFFAKKSAEPAPRARAHGLGQFEGGLDLSALEANKVTITGENVKSSDADVILERAKLSRLEIIHPTPSRIDLSAIQVARWSFGKKQERTDAGHPAADYIGVLSRMAPMDRGVWVAVEAELRNQGLEADANAVYRAMRRQVSDGLSGWRKFTDELFRCTLSYGTRPWLPLVPLFFAWILLILVFSQEQNVTAKADLVQAYGGNCEALLKDRISTISLAKRRNLKDAPACEGLTPSVLGYSWTFVDGIYLAIRHSVPVIDLISHAEWQATHRQIIMPGGLRLFGSRADALATLISIYAWIVVPISILFFGTKVFRGRNHGSRTE